MRKYFPDQRYTSDGEPELGAGIVKEVSKGKIRVYFPVADETRLYATESAPLRRVIFKVGDTIVDAKGQSLLIEKIEQTDTLYIYSGKNGKLSEADLGTMSITHNVDDRLFTGDVDAPEMFALRRETHWSNYKRKNISGTWFCWRKNRFNSSSALHRARGKFTVCTPGSAVRSGWPWKNY